MLDIWRNWHTRLNVFKIPKTFENAYIFYLYVQKLFTYDIKKTAFYFEKNRVSKLQENSK